MGLKNKKYQFAEGSILRQDEDRHKKNIEFTIDSYSGIQDETDILDIQCLLKTEHANTFNINILRIALNMREEKVACCVLAYYFVKAEEDMIIRAIKTNQLEFVQ